MANPAASIGLTFGGTDLQQNPIGIFLEIVEGLAGTATVRGTDTVVPGLAGRIARNRQPDTRRIELRGLVAGTGATEALQQDSFWDLVATLRALFDPTDSPASLVATLPNGTTATILARTLPTMVWDQTLPALARVTIELESVAPTWTIA